MKYCDLWRKLVRTQYRWLQTLLQQAREQVLRLLTTDWLISDGERDDSANDSRLVLVKESH